MTPSDEKSYGDRLKNELAHYSALLAAQGPTAGVQKVEPKVPAFELAMQIYGRYTKRKMPHADLESYAVEYARHAPGPVRLLSLGAGTGDWELAVARAVPGRVEVTLVDLNGDLMEPARRAARAGGILLETRVEDVNGLRLAPRAFELIVCRSSLHHFVELEHILGQVRQALAPAGQFLVIGEVIGRNGLMLYPETEQIAQAIFTSLPPRLRLNHYTKQMDEVVPNYDHSKGSFEAIRSEEILPLLLRHFTPIEHVAFDAFVSLLLDWRYGPNYDVTQETDRTLVTMIAELDMALVANEVLRPTALFGIFA